MPNGVATLSTSFAPSRTDVRNEYIAGRSRDQRVGVGTVIVCSTEVSREAPSATGVSTLPTTLSFISVITERRRIFFEFASPFCIDVRATIVAPAESIVGVVTY